MELWQIALIVLVAIVVVGAVAWMVMNQRRRTEHLTERYGPEYQRTMESAGDKREAESELEAREERVKQYEIKALAPEQRDRYAAKWRETQADFVDDPSGAIAAADTLVRDVMGERGYPMGDFEQRTADISVDHPHVVEEYRAAHQIAERHAGGGVETEELRQAMVHYRALFEDLLETDDTEPRPEPQPAEESEPEEDRELTGGRTA
jgi:hypothetical protein